MSREYRNYGTYFGAVSGCTGSQRIDSALQINAKGTTNSTGGWTVAAKVMCMIM